MFENLTDFSTLKAVLLNPIVLAAILAAVRNFGGYIYNCIEAHRLLPYSASQFLVTFGLWETVFIASMGVADVDVKTTTILGFVVDIIRSLKTAIGDAVKTVKSP